MWKAHIYDSTLLLRSSEKRFLKSIALDLGVEQGFSTRGSFAPRGHLAVSGDIFDWHTWDGGNVTGIQRYWHSEPWGTAEHPTVLRTSPLQPGIIWL